MVPVGVKVVRLVEFYGNELGERTLGYPSSWAHTTQELERLEKAIHERKD